MKQPMKVKRGRPVGLETKILQPGENLVLSAKDLCSIIKQCANSKVRELKIGELFMAFGEIDQSSHSLSNQVQTKPTEIEIQKISDEALAQDNLARNQDELEHLKLTDPLAWERVIAEGDLGDVNSP